ncbi:MAG: sulfite exporter TauE/SafE family protein [Thermoanaerobaculia bacterium]
MNLTQGSFLIAASFGAGVMNAMAGGGTILTFPSLVFLGLPTIAANATSTVGLLPGAMTSLFGYIDDVREQRQWLKTLFLPSLIGGAIGSVLLLRTPEKTFAVLAPLLILFATLLFMAQGILARSAARRKTEQSTPIPEAGPSPRRWTLAVVLQLGVAVYGGYFGAGIGILMLSLLGFLGLANIHAANGIKNFFGFCINVVAASYFMIKGAVVWPVALVIVAGAAIGGYSGARFAKRIGKEKARVAVVIIGFVVTAILFWQQVTK